MVVTDDGMLYIVDNERMSIGALDFDLARSWSRWPMNESQRGIFCSSYEEHRNLDKFIEHELFWAILSLARTARIHARYNKVNQLALDQLCEISRTNGMVTWPVAAREPTL
jgi:thiamine kinase-like enzyme